MTHGTQRLVKIAEAAMFLGISPGTLYRWVSEERGVPCVRFGRRCLRFDVEELKKYAVAHAAETRTIHQRKDYSR